MESLPGYDNWKLATPPSFEMAEGEECAVCHDWVLIDNLYENRIGDEVCELCEHRAICQYCGEVVDDSTLVLIEGWYACPVCQMGYWDDSEGVDSPLPF